MSMENYLQRIDIQSSIRDGRLEQILDSYDENILRDDIFKNVCLEAGSLMLDHLVHYKIEEEFDKEGNERSRSVIFHMKNIMIYILYDRVPSDDVPEKVIKNYNDTIETLRQISKGKLFINLPKKEIDSNGDGIGDKPSTLFKWGGETPRRF